MNLNNIEKTIYILLFILIIYSEYFFMRYNKKVILNYIKENYPNEYVILNMHLHPLIYIFPFIILIVTCYYFQIYHFISTKNDFLIGILLIFLYLSSIISLSLSLCLTNKRILKIYSINIFKYLGSEINLAYENIDNLRLYEYEYSKEILIDDNNKKRYRIGGISNIKKVYKTIKELKNG